MYRLTQVLILIYGIVYLMIYNGYQEKNTSIISSITLKVKVTRRNLIKRKKNSSFSIGYWLQSNKTKPHISY